MHPNGPDGPIDGRQRVARAVVPPDGSRDWVDRWILALMPEFPSRAAVRKAVARREFAVDGALLEHARVVGPGAVLDRLEPAGALPPALPLPLRVVHEDDAWAVVEKVPGYPVHGPRFTTIEHALPFNLGPSGAPDALRRPRPCHRLDAPTGGLLVVAKTARALTALNRQFQERTTVKGYRALAVGRLEGAGRVDAPLDDRDAQTAWEAVAHARSLRCGWLTDVALTPRTGRTHQLRRHLAGLGHPVLGDATYGIDGWILRGHGLFLWAVSVELDDPVTGARVRCAVDPPPKFGTWLAREARRWDRVRGGVERVPGGG